MKILISSRNKNKIREVREILCNYEILTPDDVGSFDEVTEDGKTFEENALKKAREICRQTGMITIADDSGLCVDALGGAPGVYSARFAGEGHNDEENIVKLLSLLQNEENRSAKFVSAAAVCFPDETSFVALGECKGTILREKRGSNGFGYDPVFYYEDFGKTFAEISEEEKNSISHRRRAFDALRAYLDKVNL